MSKNLGEVDNIAGDTDSMTLQRYIIATTQDLQLTLLMTSIQVGFLTKKQRRMIDLSL